VPDYTRLGEYGDDDCEEQVPGGSLTACGSSPANAVFSLPRAASYDTDRVVCQLAIPSALPARMQVAVEPFVVHNELCQVSEPEGTVDAR
jgi:hypothetical protein